MSGKMRKRQSKFSKHVGAQYSMAKSFHAPQKDSSVRQKRNARLNNYKEDQEQKEQTPKPEPEPEPQPEPELELVAQVEPEQPKSKRKLFGKKTKQ